MNKIFNNNLTNEEIDELVKKIINIPVEENKSCISSFGSINVDDLIKEIESLKKIPTYDLLLKENQQLKEDILFCLKSMKQEMEMSNDSKTRQKMLSCYQILSKWSDK